jgi:hypothetical protein
MAFNRATFATVGAHSSDTPTVWAYSTTDVIATVLASDYFREKRFEIEAGDFIFVVANGIAYHLDVLTSGTVVTTKQHSPIFSGEGSGFVFAEISAHVNAVVTALPAQDTDYQITVFDTNGPSNNMTPDHTNDHITVDYAGKYLCMISVSFRANQSQADNFTFHVSKNNNDAEFENLHSDRTTGTLQSFGSASLSGILDLAVDDTIELWVQRTTGGGASRDIVVKNVTLSLIQIGGT